MPTTYWRLKYDRGVTAKLYELREAGFALHNAIKALKNQPEPWQAHWPSKSVPAATSLNCKATGSALSAPATRKTPNPR